MTTDLGQRLDELATQATRGLELAHPELPPIADAHDRSERPRLALAVAAAVAVVLLGAIWWLNRPDANVVDVAGGSPATQSIPSLLLEEPTPLADLSPRLRSQFEEIQSSVLDDLEPGEWVEFPGAHVLERGDVTVAVGLDTTGRMLCVAQDSDVLGSRAVDCTTMADFAVDRWLESSAETEDGYVHVVFAADEVTAAKFGRVNAEVVRNVVVFTDGFTGGITPLVADGSPHPGVVFPDPDASGELELPSAGTMDLLRAGCTISASEVVAEGVFLSSDGLLVEAEILPEGVFASGPLGPEPIDIVALDAQVRTSTIDGTLVVTASWDDESGSSSLTVDCGDNLIDLSYIR